MRILVHDPAAGGHHPMMLQSIVTALQHEHEVIVAARPALVEQCDGGLTAQVLPLAEAAAGGAAADLRAFDAATAAVWPAHRLHLYAIRPVLARWALRRRASVPTSILVISPPALHYGEAYGTPLNARERANALVKEALVRRFRRRGDAHAVITMDPAATERWQRHGGAATYTLPEAPVPPVPAAARRDGVVLYGALSPRKGLGLLVAALATGAEGLRLVVAGRPEPDYVARMDAELAALRAAGVRVHEQRGWLPDAQAFGLLAQARCVAIPYVGHKGSSRVLVEAAAAGTPVVVHGDGMVGALVRRHGLGLCVDASDPRALRDAVLALSGDADAPARHAPALSAFAALSSPAAFGAAVRAPFAAASGGAGETGAGALRGPGRRAAGRTTA